MQVQAWAFKTKITVAVNGCIWSLKGQMIRVEDSIKFLIHNMGYSYAITLKYVLSMIRKMYSSIFAFQIEKHFAYVFICLYSREI